MIVDIENEAQLLAYLRARGDLAHDESPAVRVLSGGVSNKTVYVELDAERQWVIKQCLPKLRVKVDWFSSPERIHREALALEHLPALTPPGTIPAYVFEDAEQHILAMQAVPQPHENWKTMLLAGRLSLGHARQFAQILAGIHRGSHQRREQYMPIFGDRSFFESLRVEAYYAFTASQAPAAAAFYEPLIAEMRALQLSIVHGDYSPKNILVYHEQLILLDHEVIHMGDPAFDIGFSMTHLLSKAHHVAAQRHLFAGLAHVYWKTYQQACGPLAQTAEFEARAARHGLACLLARVDGRSPLEYLTPAERDRQRAVVLREMSAPPQTIEHLISEFIVRLDHYDPR